MRLIQKIPIFSAFFMISMVSISTALAQNSSQAPAAILLPWHTIQLDPSARAKSQMALQESQVKLAEILLNNPMSLKRYLASQAGSPALSSNLEKRTQTYQISTTPHPIGTNVVFEPILCSLADQYVLFLSAKDLASGLLLSSKHLIFSKKEYLEDLTENTLGLSIGNKMQSLASQLTTPPQYGPSNLKISFALGKETNGARKGSSLCLNMLLEENLMSKHKVMRLVDSEHFYTLKRIFKTPRASTRSNRKVINLWSFPKENVPSFPLTLELTSSYAEAVFAKNISPRLTSIYTLSVANNEIRMIPDKNIERFLNTESTALNSNVNPAISKIYRAWVYLDKGRAWGLKMDDRLVIKGQDGDIKGHVVGYFGPEMQIRSPITKEIINEGAIVYIRKGQHKTKMGQEFEFDPRRFPYP